MDTFKEVTIYFGLAGEKDISLADLLSCIPAGERREWSLLYIKAEWYPEDVESMSFQAEAEMHGIVHEWDALCKLQDRFALVGEMMVCGGERVSHLRKALPFEELLAAAEYVIELMDGGFWVVHTRDEQAIDNFRDRFSRMEVMDI